MAGNFSDYLEGKILDHIFVNTAYTAPTNHYIRQWTATLSDASTPATAGQVSGGSYAAVAVASGAAWSRSGSSVSNASDITFPTATGSWGTMTDTLDSDNVTAGSGNSIVYGAMTASKTIGSGDVFKYPAGQYAISLD